MITRASAVALLCTLAVWSAGCSESTSSSPVATATIGSAGGTVSVTEGKLAGTELVIPAGALSADTAIKIYDGQISKVSGALQVGPPALVEPSKLELLIGASLTLPFDASSIPSGTSDSDMRAGYRDGTGQVSFVELQSVDRTAGLATLEIEAFGTWWIVVPDAFVTADYIPLNDGDSYSFDGDVILTIARTSNEPNLQGTPLIKLTFTGPYMTEGLYWDDSNGGVELLGRFFVPDAQERLDSAARLLPERALIGTPITATYTFLGFIPYGSSFVDYSGVAITDTTPEERTQVSVPAGTFDECVLVSFDTEYQLTPPLTGSESIRMWLARDVGPIQVQRGNASTLRLRSAIVAGQPIPAN